MEKEIPLALSERFQALLDGGDMAALEGAWMDEIAAGETNLADPQPFLSTADALVARGEKERAEVLLELFLTACERSSGAIGLEVLRRLVLNAPRRTELRASFIERFREVHAGDPLAEVYLGIAFLKASSDPGQAFHLLDRLLQFRPGTCVYHAAGWGVGTVESIDPVLAQAVVDLEKKRHHRVDLKAIADILDPLPPEHFLALSRDGGGRLRALAESDPVDLVGILISSFGNPLELKAIKARLVSDIVPAAAWSRFWQKTKGLLRDSGFYRVADRTPYTVERMSSSVSYEEELLRQFKGGSWAERLSIARKHGRDRAGFPRLRERAIAEFRAALEREGGSRALEAALALERMAPGEPGLHGELVKALSGARDPVEAILGVEGADERRRAMEVLVEARGPSWPEVALELFTRGDDWLRDEAARLLWGSPVQDRAATLVAEAVRAPRNSPDLFAWACRAFLAGDSFPLLEPLRSYPLQEILGRVLDALDNLGMRAERDGRAVVRDTLGRVRNLLAAEDRRFFREVVHSLSREEGRGFYQRVLSSGGLSEPLRVKLLEILAAAFPDITRSEVRPIWEEDAIYTTEAGLARKQAEFRDLTEKKLPQNFQDIGRAAAFGDLSENAEYTSALEERDRLTKRATDIKAQLDRVRLLTPQMVKDSEVGLGARVRLVNPRTGHEIAYRILGPWDGSPEDGVLSYLSPLAITLFGRRVGDEVEAQLPGGTERFRVVEVASAFEPPGGSSP